MREHAEYRKKYSDTARMLLKALKALEKAEKQVADQKQSLYVLQYDQANAMPYLKGFYDDPNCPSIALSVHNMFLKLKEYEKANEHSAARQIAGCSEKSGGTDGTQTPTNKQ
jgi:hypothetical protein